MFVQHTEAILDTIDHNKITNGTPVSMFVHHTEAILDTIDHMVGFEFYIRMWSLLFYTICRTDFRFVGFVC